MNTPVSGAPRLLLRLEGLAVLISAVIAYQALGASWSLFAILLLVPDVALGLGLKFGTAFRDTHLGSVGRGAPVA